MAPQATMFTWFSDWYIILGHFSVFMPRLPYLLFLLPLWPSQTAKIRAFAEGGHVCLVRQMIGGKEEQQSGGGSRSRSRSCCCCRKRSKEELGDLLLGAVDADRGGASSDAACRSFIQKYLDRGADPNRTDAKGMSAIQNLSVKGFSRSVDALLAGGANPNLKSTFDGGNALHEAVDPAVTQDSDCCGKVIDVRCSGSDKIQTVRALLEKKYHLNRSQLNNRGQTPYMVAASKQAAAKQPVIRDILKPNPCWEQVSAALHAKDPLQSLVALLVSIGGGISGDGFSSSSDSENIVTSAATKKSKMSGEDEKKKSSLSSTTIDIHLQQQFVPCHASETKSKTKVSAPLPLHIFQLRDMLWAPTLEADEYARRQRRSLVVSKLIATLVKKASLKVLTLRERALLIHACTATASSPRKTARWKVLVRCWVSGADENDSSCHKCNGVFMRMFHDNVLVVFNERSVYQNDEGAIIYFDNFSWKLHSEGEIIEGQLKLTNENAWAYTLQGSRHPTPPSGKWTHRDRSSFKITVVAAQRRTAICNSANVKLNDRVVGKSKNLTVEDKAKPGLAKSCRGTVIGFRKESDGVCVGEVSPGTPKGCVLVNFDGLQVENCVDKGNANELSHLFEADMGKSADQDPVGDNRHGHRAEFDAIMSETMSIFAHQLAREYKSLSSQPRGPELLAIPSSQYFSQMGSSDLQQNSPTVSGSPSWLKLGGQHGDLASACQATFYSSGLLGSSSELCDLIQRGIHRLLTPEESNLILKYPPHLNRGATPLSFWLSFLCLSTIQHHMGLQLEFATFMSSRVDAASSTTGERLFPRGVLFKMAPLKRYERIREKALEYWTELKFERTIEGACAAVGRVVDIVRCSFVVPTASAMIDVYNYFCSTTLEVDGIKAIRCKNEHNKDAACGSGGYRDIKFNLLFQSRKTSGLNGRAIMEVQIILSSFLAVKKKMHAVYRVDRGDFG